MAHNPANELASTLQSAHLNRAPSPTHDINPSTAASQKIPVDIVSPSPETDADADDEDSSSIASLTSSILVRPRPRRSSQPGAKKQHLPLPDLRFEQTYLASLKNATSGWEVAYITIKDQLLFPLVQGVAYHLAVLGWRRWSAASEFKGRGVGARIRRWWWGVNGWNLPGHMKEGPKEKEIQDFYVGKFGSAQGE